jgi:hypothetical protein
VPTNSILDFGFWILDLPSTQRHFFNPKSKI